MPSGVDVDTGELDGAHVTADVTVTFGTHKVAHLVDPAAEASGAVHLVDLGLDLPDRRGRGAPARRRRRAAAAPRPAGAQVHPRRGRRPRRLARPTPGPGCSAWPAPRPGCAGWCATSVTTRSPTGSARRTPRSSAPGRVQAWVVGSGGGDDGRPTSSPRRVADGVPLVVDADALRARGRPARRPRGADAARRRTGPDARGRAGRGRGARRSRTPARPPPGTTPWCCSRGAARWSPRPGGGSGRRPPACPGWPPPAPATCSAGWSGRCSPPASTPYDAASVGSWLHGAAATLAVGRRTDRRRAGGARRSRGRPRAAARRWLTPASSELPGWKNRTHESAPAARAEIVVDLAAIRHNVATLRELVGDVRMMTVVKADGYGHGMVEVGPGRARRPAPTGSASRRSTRRWRCARPATPGRLLCWLDVPGEDYAAAIAADVDVTAYSVAELDEIAAAADGRRRGPRVQLKVDTGLSRGGAPLDGLAGARGRRAAAERGRARCAVTGVWSHLAVQRRARRTRPTTPRSGPFREALAGRRARPGCDPEVRHLANSAAAILRPSSRFDLVRCGLASYGLDPAPGHDPPTLGLRAGDDRARPGSRWSSAVAGRRGRLLRAHLDRRPRHDARPGAGRVRRRRARAHAGNAAEVAGRRPAAAGARAGSAWTSSSSTSTRRRRRGRATRSCSSAPAATATPTAQDWAEACGDHLLRDRHPDRRADGPTPHRRRRPPHEIARRIARASRPAPPASRRAGTAGGGRRARRRVIARPRRRGPDAARARCAREPITVRRRRRGAAARRGRRVSRRRAAPAARAAGTAAADRRLRARLRAQPGLLALPARGLPRPGPRGLLRPALARSLRAARRGARDHRPARPRPARRSSTRSSPRARSCWSATRWAG